MKYYDIIIKNYYHQEAWGDRNGIQIIIQKNNDEFGSWLTEADRQNAFDRALYDADAIASFLSVRHKYKDRDKNKEGNIIYIYDWYSIGD